MPFTDADHNPITCHTCPFKVGIDCTAMPQIPYTNQHGMQRWTYPPALNPCLRHPALGVTKLPEGVAAVLGMPNDIVVGTECRRNRKDITDPRAGSTAAKYPCLAAERAACRRRHCAYAAANQRRYPLCSARN